MQIKPVSGPTAIQQPTSNTTEAKARAVEAFMNAGKPPQQEAVPNPTQVSPEEFGALRQQAQRQETQPAVDPESAPAVASNEQPAAPETTPDPTESARFAKLARQEKALRARIQQQEQQFKQREQELLAREAKLQQTTPQADYYTKEQIKQNALRVLQEAGITYEELTQQQISEQTVDPVVRRTIQELKAEIQALKAETEASKNSYKEAQDQSYQAALKQIRTDVNQLVTKDASFELIRATGSQKDVVELIEKTYNQDGVLLTVEEAASEVESYLEQETERLTKLSKIQRKMQANKASQPAPTSKPQQSATTTPQQQPMKTLTNANSSSRQLSARERAMLAFKGELKS